MLRTHDRPQWRSFAPVLTWLFAAALVGGVPARTSADVKPFSAKFKARDVAVTGGTLHVRVGGSGPAVLMLHGFGDTGDMWAPLATALIANHTIVVPDLRGMGVQRHAPFRRSGKELLQVLSAGVGCFQPARRVLRLQAAQDEAGRSKEVGRVRD